jgi:hypothetical protein
MAWNWRDLVGVSIFLLLLGSAVMANVGQGSLPNLRGAWVAQAMR